MKKIISVLTTLTLSITGSFLFSSSASCEDKSTSHPIKIMVIGDSITDGYGIAGSYRKYLFNELTKKGYNIDMVGSKCSDMKVDFTDSETGESFTYDDDNTGYSGYAVKEYPGRNGILETLKSTNCLLTCKPDIVILQIGTNNIIDNHDAAKTREDYIELIDYILGNISDESAFFVTTIPDVDPNRSEVRDWFSNYRHSEDWQTNYSDEEAEEKILNKLHVYNADLTADVNKKANTSILSIRNTETSKGTTDKGPYLYSADVASVITDVKTELADGVHPNNKGYKLMGEYWAEKIDSYLKNKQAEENTYGQSDLTELQSFILRDPSSVNSNISLEKYDINKDNTVDIFDLVSLRKELNRRS